MPRCSSHGEQPDRRKAAVHDEQVGALHVPQHGNQQAPFRAVEAIQHRVQHQAGSGGEQPQGARQHIGFAGAVGLHAEFGLVFQPGRDPQGGRVGGHQAQAAPARFWQQRAQQLDQALVQGHEGGCLHFLAGLRQGTFGHGSRGRPGKAGKGVIQQRLQSCLETAQQEGDDNREGQDPLPGEVGVRLTMRRNEVGGMNEISKVG